jgi:malate synthase
VTTTQMTDLSRERGLDLTGPGTPAWEKFDQILATAQAMIADLEHAGTSSDTIRQWVEQLVYLIENRDFD